MRICSNQHVETVLRKHSTWNTELGTDAKHLTLEKVQSRARNLLNPIPICMAMRYHEVVDADADADGDGDDDDDVDGELHLPLYPLQALSAPLQLVPLLSPPLSLAGGVRRLCAGSF